MPRRPKQHQLEDYSINQFKQLLPSSWIIREKDRDYGIDLEVELVNSQDNPTGEVFLVQMKATDSELSSAIRSVPMKIDTLMYYKNFQLPIMLVRYSKVWNKFYFKWVNNVDLYYAKKESKTIKVNFEERELLDSDSIEKIENHIKKFKTLKSGLIELPITVSILVKESLFENENQVVTESKIISEISRYKKFVTIVSEGDDPLISVIIQKNEIKISASEVYGNVFHDIPLDDTELLHKTTTNVILIGISLILDRVGQFEWAAKILIDAELIPVALYFKLAPSILHSLVKSSYLEQALKIFDDYSDDKNDVEIQILQRMALLYSSQTSPDVVESILKKQLNDAIKSGNTQVLATAHYNLGNHYRAKSKYLDAINHYQKARKFDSIYEKQPYFFRELGGLLFLQGRFSISAKLYKKSIELERNEDVLPLYADALMFSGRYEESLSVLLEYFECKKEPKDEFFLKHFVLKSIVDNFKVSTQKRKINNALELMDSQKDHLTYPSIQEVLEVDMLCSEAWFRFGMLYKDDNKFSDAAIAFCACGLIQTRDIEAWTYASLYAVVSEIPVLYAIVRTAYYFNNDKYLLSFLELLSKNNLPTDNLKEIKRAIYDMTKDIRCEKKPKELRVLNSEGLFEDILSKMSRDDKHEE